MARLTKKESERKRNYAYQLFIDTREAVTKDEICERVGISIKSLNSWIEKGNWERARKSMLVTRKKMIADLYDQLEWLNNEIKNRDVKVADKNEANNIAVITSSIKRLETETSIAEIYEVVTDFLSDLKPQNKALHDDILPYFDSFIQNKMK